MHRKAAVAGDTGHYSFFPKMRLFARADLSGSDLANSESYSGTAQLGVAYAIGADASCNLSCPYLGIGQIVWQWHQAFQERSVSGS